MKIIIRLIALPFWSAIILIAAIRDWAYTSYLFARFGGEGVTYKSKEEKHLIASKLRELINQNKP